MTCFLFYLHSSAHFIIKYSFLGENTVFGITEYSFWFPEVGRSAFMVGICAGGELSEYNFIYVFRELYSWWQFSTCLFTCTVEPLYNEVLGTINVTLLYQVSHYIRVKEQRNIKSWDQQIYLAIRGFCYIRPLYNEVPLYMIHLKFMSNELCIYSF